MRAVSSWCTALHNHREIPSFAAQISAPKRTAWSVQGPLDLSDEFLKLAIWRSRDALIEFDSRWGCAST